MKKVKTEDLQTLGAVWEKAHTAPPTNFPQSIKQTVSLQFLEVSKNTQTTKQPPQKPQTQQLPEDSSEKKIKIEKQR